MTKQCVLAELRRVLDRPETREEQWLNKHQNNSHARTIGYRVADALRRKSATNGVKPQPGLLLPPF